MELRGKISFGWSTHLKLCFAIRIKTSASENVLQRIVVQSEQFPAYYYQWNIPHYCKTELLSELLKTSFRLRSSCMKECGWAILAWKIMKKCIGEWDMHEFSFSYPSQDQLVCFESEWQTEIESLRTSASATQHHVLWLCR